MDLSLGFVRALYVFVLLCCVLFYLRRFLWRLRKRQGRGHLGFCPTYTSAGNALQALQVMAQPRAGTRRRKSSTMKRMTTMREIQTIRGSISRQLRRIRRGKKVERLTVLL